MNARVIAAWVVAALLTGASLAAAQTADPRDVKVGDNIVRQVNSYAKFTIFDDINANVKDGAQNAMPSGDQFCDVVKAW